MIIALCGLAGSGKTTAANILVHDFKFARRPFAYALKAMISAGFGIPGAVLDGPREGKEQPLEIFGGKSIRYVMQTLGTEWGRELIDTDLWVRAWERGAAGLPRVVCDDARFPNEELAIRKLGGTIIMLKRFGAGAGDNPGHISEQLMLKPDVTFYNNFSIDDLRLRLKGIVEMMEEEEIVG